jgi:hypothetical protein
MSKRSVHVLYEECHDCAEREVFPLWQRLNAAELSIFERDLLHDGEIDHLLALDGDYYTDALHKLSILAFLQEGARHGEDATFGGRFLSYLQQHAQYDYTGPFDRQPPWSLVLRFLASEFELIRSLPPPVPALDEHLMGLAFRWRTAFPPMWYRFVLRYRAYPRLLPERE